MSKAARSVLVFGVYLVATGALLMGAPGLLLSVLRLPPATDPWIHVLGVVVMALGMYYLSSARTEQAGFFRATVWVRAFVLLAFVGLVVAEIAPAVLIGFGLVDAAGAIWTRLSLADATVGVGAV